MVTNKKLPLQWLPGVRRCRSSNCEPRPDGEQPSLLVIHNISLPPGEYGKGYVDQLFTNSLDCSLHPYFERLKELQVSSHILISRKGDVTQYVSFADSAWHAGESCFDGRVACNQFSIGVELEGTDDEAFTERQYKALVDLTLQIQAAYPGITGDRITGHSDIAPKRKTDPGPFFDWDKYRQQLCE